MSPHHISPLKIHNCQAFYWWSEMGFSLAF